jgi:hypothetical protein
MIFDIIRFNQFALDLLAESDERRKTRVESTGQKPYFISRGGRKA